MTRYSRCTKCDYDVHGLTTDKCPECGSVLSGQWPSRRLQVARLCVDHARVFTFGMLAFFYCVPDTIYPIQVAVRLGNFRLVAIPILVIAAWSIVMRASELLSSCLAKPLRWIRDIAVLSMLCITILVGIAYVF